MAPAVESAWSAFFKEVAVCDPIELKKQGWKTNAEIITAVKSTNEGGRQIADRYVRLGTLEKRAFKIISNGKRKNVNFYRPKK